MKRMKRNERWIILGVLLLLIGSIFLYMQKPAEHHLSAELYDELYNQQQTWTIENFPSPETNYNGSHYAWAWSHVASSLVNMYRVTGDEKYLDVFVQQAEYIITQTDEQLGIESFTGTGLSLPAWSDQARYTDGEFNYIYPVHTGMITVPILRFIDTVYNEELDQYMDQANVLLNAVGKAIAVHNQDDMWVDFSDTEGFYLGHPYGEGIVSEAGKIGILNRISIYLAAAGLFDKLNGSDIYTERIEKSLNYIKYSLLKYDPDFDAYYWSYWEDQILTKNWEDISHASITVYGLYVLYEEAGFTVFDEDDFQKFANNIDKIIDEENNPVAMRKHIHKRSTEEREYYTQEGNPYYYDVFRWSFLGIYDNTILKKLTQVSREIDMNEMSPLKRLESIAAFLYAEKQS